MGNQVTSLIRSDRTPNWQDQLSDLITDPEELLSLLQLDPETCPYSLEALRQFPLNAHRPIV